MEIIHQIFLRPDSPDLDELKQKTVSLYAVSLILIAGTTSWLLLPSDPFRVGPFWVSLSLLIEGVVIYYFRMRNPRLSQYLALIGPILTFALALQVMEGSFVPFFGTLIVIMNAAVSPMFGLFAALSSTLCVVVLVTQRELMMASLSLLWLTATAQCISSRSLYTALNWAWSSQERANALLAELRHRQAELNRTVTALTEATRRLQRTSYELAVARLRADEMRDLKARFAANISHELRTPLNLILGFSEMMYLTPDVYGDMQWPSTLKRDVRQIYQNSRQLLALVNDVLDLSRIDGAEMPVHRERCDISSIIREAVATVGDLARGRDLMLRTQLPNEVPLLYLDRTRIRQVLINLLNNALRFTERGAITVALSVEAQEVIVSVTDTGIGIPPEELGRIFDEFHQVDMSLRRTREGAGLGLAISKRFIGLHGGRIWAESQVGQGSTFYFSLPLSADAGIMRLRQTQPLEPRRPHQAALVFLEPDSGTYALVQRYLQDYLVLQARNEEEAKSLITEWHPQALIRNVPPGEEFCQSLWKDLLALVPPDLPIITCSIASQRWIAGLTPTEGCLTKPFGRQELLEHIRDLDGVKDVLVVDDDRGFVQLVSRYLESTHRGYTVRWAYDGVEALAKVRDRAPDLILLDLIMPEMDGLQFLEILRSESELAHIPVLIVTATDYAQRVLERQASFVVVGRRKAFRPMEAIRYLAAISRGASAGARDSAVPIPEAVPSG